MLQRRPILGWARVAACLAAILALVAATVPAVGAPGGRRAPVGSFQQESGGIENLDARRGRVAPTAAQTALAARPEAQIRFNRFGTPASVLDVDSALASGLGSDAVEAARTYLRANRELYRLSESDIAALELVHNVPVGDGRALLFRQTFDGVPAAHDGSVALAYKDGAIVHASSALTTDGRVTNSQQIGVARAVQLAAEDVGITIDSADIAEPRSRDGWLRMNVEGLSHTQSARLRALPTPSDGVRLVYQVSLVDLEPRSLAFTSFVDAATGEVLIRESNIDYLEDNPTWEVFPNIPPLDYSSTDTRELWCWSAAPGCDRVVGNAEAVNPWDADGRSGRPTLTTRGNAARSTEKWLSASSRTLGERFAEPSRSRDYRYEWTNQWFEERCNPEVFTSPQENDINAALANLFVMHNRMHDWSYRLGFTENTYNLQDHNFRRGGEDRDPEHGNAQAGGIVGGPPDFRARDNANQFTPPDGQLPITNMYLWQPIAGGFYAPCVDGDFDMSVIGHEYTHAISNRMVAGADQRLVGAQANAMGESWSDLTAVEYLQEYGFAPVANENPFAVGPYVTGDPVSGIRNYGMNFSPLNYSNIGYDLTGPQVHADGEIWSATNYRIREALIGRYGAGSAELQRSCADGETPITQCPGNRRWMQIVFDAYLLMPPSGEVSMLDARDAYLAADRLRFGGTNQDLLWNVFASRGFGENARTTNVNDGQPTPNFESPFANEATVTFRPVEDGEAVANAELFIGEHEQRSTPIADTDRSTATPAGFPVVAGTYPFIARADGHGASRGEFSVTAGGARDLSVVMPTNLSSASNGATATGDGVGVNNLIDDTEATNWASLGSPVQGKEVTVRLDPSRPQHDVTRVQVSAMLRPADPDNEDDPPQSRFSALRQFRILACDARGANRCEDDSDFTLIYTSPADAFPSIAPRPRAPELTIRSFDVPPTTASHIRLEVVTNQCTGTPDYHGDQDDDPRNITDCSAGSTQDDNVRAAELQVFAR